MKKRRSSVGLTSSAVAPAVIAPVAPAVASDAIRVVTFPVVPTRVSVSRPRPDPVRRVCPFCHAAFDDYTRRPSTLYCRASCRVQMSRVKARAGVATLAAVTGAPASVVSDLYEVRGLKEIERLLNLAGWYFVPIAREWVKRV